MKKLLCILLILVAMTSLLAGCIGAFTCDLCGEDKFGIMHKGEIMGGEITYCDDCKEEIEKWEDMLK